MKHTINIYYFPKELRYLSFAGFAAVAYLIYIGQWRWAVPLALLIVFILTAKYVTTIDLDRKKIIDAFSFFGIDLENEVQDFKTLERIVISKGNYSQKVTTRSTDRQINWSDYTGTLIYDGGKSLDLLTRNDRSELVNQLRIYATALNVELIS